MQVSNLCVRVSGVRSHWRLEVRARDGTVLRDHRCGAGARGRVIVSLRWGDQVLAPALLSQVEL